MSDSELNAAWWRLEALKAERKAVLWSSSGDDEDERLYRELNRQIRELTVAYEIREES